MVIIGVKRIICDHCGAEQTIQTDFNDVISVIKVANEKSGKGWQRTRGEGILCGECYPGYKEIIDKCDHDADWYLNRN